MDQHAALAADIPRESPAGRPGFANQCLFQILPEAETRAVEHDPAIGLRDTELGTNLLGARTLDFPEVEGAGRGCGQPREAAFDHFPEPLVVERLLRAWPLRGRRHPIARGIEKRVARVLVGVIRIRRKARARACGVACLAPMPVDDLVLENARQPGPQLRFAPEFGLSFHGGKQRFLHQFLGRARRAQSGERVAVEKRAVRGEGFRCVQSHGVHDHFLGDESGPRTVEKARIDRSC